jgi:prophage antirepressor-like protein
MRELMFESTTLHFENLDGVEWVSAADVARALGYARANKVSQIYERHEAEFTDSMSMLMMRPDLGPQNGVPGQMRMNRMFTLRGAHLIAMFARTEKGQKFRRWVLDLIESQGKQNKSLIAAYYEAKAEEAAQAKFASMCGRGLNEHKFVMPPIRDKVKELLGRLQPSLPLEPAH